jgi:hypothetical protein
MNNHYLYLVLFIASCSSINLEIPQKVEDAARKTYETGVKIIPFQIRELFGSGFGYLLGKIKSNEQINTDIAKSIPYATILVTYNDAKAIMVLSSVNNEIMKWVSADEIILFTYQGKVIQTIGFENDMHISNPPSIGNFNIKENSTLSSIDIFTTFTNPDLISKSSSILLKGEEVTFTNMLSNKDYPVNIVYEKFTVSDIRYKVRNKYWVDKEGKVYKSRQSLAPGLSLDIEVLKQFRG